MFKSSWTGLALCALVIYFGVVHSLRNPMVLLNAHAVILVCGGTVAIAFLTYPLKRLLAVMDYIVMGFLFPRKKTEAQAVKELIAQIDACYGRISTFPMPDRPHPFVAEALRLLENRSVDVGQMETILKDRRNSLKRQYMEDAKILNNIAKYPPHLGLLGAASGMIEMMSGLGKDGIEIIGGSMAIALTATLWGVGLNNFVFLPLSDNSMKVSEDELHMRDLIIECFMMMKRKEAYVDVIRCCLNRLSLADRTEVRQAYHDSQESYRDVA